MTHVRILTRAGSTLLTGLVGAAAYDAVRTTITRDGLHEGAVTAFAWGIRGKRRAEVAAEQLRLATGDLVAEARARTGEQSPPPGVGDVAHDHDH
ncbi:DUF1490 family protein [Nocardioides sp. IC4_145]|nr:DUF1490 family protein [Nocardioides sp. IC4_145]